MALDLNSYEAPPEWASRHPVSKIYWIPVELIEANDYNPNVVAPPEMKLLELSIGADGYTSRLSYGCGRMTGLKLWTAFTAFKSEKNNSPCCRVSL